MNQSMLSPPLQQILQNVDHANYKHSFDHHRKQITLFFFNMTNPLPRISVQFFIPKWGFSWHNIYIQPVWVSKSNCSELCVSCSDELSYHTTHLTSQCDTFLLSYCPHPNNYTQCVCVLRGWFREKSCMYLRVGFVYGVVCLWWGGAGIAQVPLSRMLRAVKSPLWRRQWKDGSHWPSDENRGWDGGSVKVGINGRAEAN